MKNKPIVLKEKFDQVTECWSPKIIAEMNDYHFKIAKIQGEFDWHKHPETDETFIVISGSLKIEFRDSHVRLSDGSMYVVQKGIEHKPIADDECNILLIEPAGTRNTGDIVTNRTHSVEEWI